MKKMAQGPCDTIHSSAGKERPKTWSELHKSVRNIRCRLSNLSTKVPSSFTFRRLRSENGAYKTRLYFLSVPMHVREATILYTDLPDAGETQQNMTPGRRLLSWHSLLEPSFHVIPFRGKISKEEQLQLERKRLVTWGITAYELDLDSGKFVFPAYSSLFMAVDNGLSTSSYFPVEVKTSCGGARLDPQLSPSNPDIVAYVCSGDIWVQHLASGNEQRLTFVHKGSKSLAEDPLTAGQPAYVTQEEFHRFTGYWWQPKSEDGLYRILYEEVDESEVEILYFPPSTSEDQCFEEYRFPRAGTPNAKSTLKLLQFSISGNGEIIDLQYLQMQECLHILFPWMEYLVRVGWMANGKHLWAQLLDRRQVRLELVLIPLSAFVPLNSSQEMTSNHIAPPSTYSPVYVLVREQTDIWINVHDILYFFKEEDDLTLSFIWASEETGFRHLYYITVELSQFTENHIDNGVTVNDDFLCPRILKNMPLTWGEWEVLDKQIWVNESRQLVYFMALKDGPLERHLYVVSLLNPSVIRRVTCSDYSHAVTMNKDCTLFATVYSSVCSLPACEIFSVDCSECLPSVNALSFVSLGFLLEPSTPDESYHQPQLFSYQIQSGETLYSMVFKPSNMEPGRKYPTVLSVYGGPEVQLISNSFKGMRQLRLHMLTALGYVVVVIDSRGSRHRGLKFEAYIKDRMGTVEISDQVEMLQWLASCTGYIDINRVAICGWSYGGYLALMGLAQRPDIFKVAIAGAPVTSWRLYDTAYTERYMGLPCENSQGYRSGSVLAYIDNFPNETNRLLIIHGLIDENVHFLHTREFIDMLIKAGKPYQLQLYPKERHSLRHLDASEHYETTLLSFLQQCL